MVTQAAKCAALDKCSGTQFVIIQISKTSTFNWRPISYNEAKAILFLSESQTLFKGGNNTQKLIPSLHV